MQNKSEIKVKVDFLESLQSLVPNVVVGGSLAAYLHGLEYKPSQDIDLFTDTVEITEVLSALNKLGIKYESYGKSNKRGVDWINGKFKANIKYGYSLTIPDIARLDFKKVEFSTPYTFDTEVVTWENRKVIVQTKEILEQGIRAFQNYCLDLGATRILDHKYKNINKVFPKRKLII